VRASPAKLHFFVAAVALRHLIAFGTRVAEKLAIALADAYLFAKRSRK
jgi:hypothetical protein